MSCRIVIVDYGSGNLSSVERSLSRLGANFVVSGRPEDIESGDKLILAGVGHFGSAMQSLSERKLVKPLEKAILFDRKPVLGICLGMELMAQSSEESSEPGLGWVEAKVIRFQLSDTVRYKVPHIGWSRIKAIKSSRLMKDVKESAEFYFLHAYHLEVGDQSMLLSECEHEGNFPASIEIGNIFGVQYHPEKSRRAGLQLLKNFMEI